jgi:hypothetical protein
MTINDISRVSMMGLGNVYVVHSILEIKTSRSNSIYN